MKKTNYLLALIALLLSCASTIYKPIPWKVNEAYSIKCSGGSFRGLKATIVFDEADPSKSKITASIDARTFSTGKALMDEHAKDKDGLFTAKYPEIKFVSTTIKKTKESEYEAVGNLTLKGITKEVKFPFSFNSEKSVLDKFPMVPKETFSGVLSIRAKDFNITREGVLPTLYIELIIPVSR